MRHLIAPVFLIFGCALALLGPITIDARQTLSSVEDRLSQHMGFSGDDIRSLNEGSAVIRSLDTRVREELAYVGAIRINVSAAQFIEQFRDIESFEVGPGIPQIGLFASPPQLEDLASLEWPAADLRALRNCHPGSCDVKLSSDAMQRFGSEVEWTFANAAGQANELVREMILELVIAYQANGNSALGHYDDGNKPLVVAPEFSALLDSENPLPVPVPELLRYLEEYPNQRPALAEDFFYWTLVDFGLKPTIRVNHVTLYPLGESGREHLIAIKQIYASHYFHTTLELRFLIDDEDLSDRRGTSLISITRSRSDGMTGFKGLFLRPIITRRSRNAVLVYLEQVRRQVERLAPTLPETP